MNLTASHEYVFRFGMYRGLPISEVPASYLLWLHGLEKCPDQNLISQYVIMNRRLLIMQSLDETNDYSSEIVSWPENI